MTASTATSSAEVRAQLVVVLNYNLIAPWPGHILASELLDENPTRGYLPDNIVPESGPSHSCESCTLRWKAPSRWFTAGARGLTKASATKYDDIVRPEDYGAGRLGGFGKTAASPRLMVPGFRTRHHKSWLPRGARRNARRLLARRAGIS